jgi:hypothetical protein
MYRFLISLPLPRFLALGTVVVSWQSQRLEKSISDSLNSVLSPST